MKPALVLILTSACVMHNYPYVNKVRDYKQDQYAASMPASDSGSLYNGQFVGLFRDTRAARLGDIITIKIDENEEAMQQAQTETSKEASIGISMPALWDVASRLAAAGAQVDLAKILEASTSNKFKGAGATSRSGKLVATLQARVKKTLPNGDLYLEGHKIVAVNGEDHHLYVSGVIRLEDVQPDNSVPSSKVADAQVVYNGMGVLSEQQHPGWLARIFSMITPL